MATLGLSGGDPGDRYAVGRTAHVVEGNRAEEVDAGGVAAVLTADAEREVGIRPSPGLGRELDEAPHPGDVDGLERAPGEDALTQIEGQQLPLGVVPGEADRRLRQIVRAEAEEVGVRRDLPSDHARP